MKKSMTRGVSLMRRAIVVLTVSCLLTGCAADTPAENVNEDPTTQTTEVEQTETGVASVETVKVIEPSVNIRLGSEEPEDSMMVYDDGTAVIAKVLSRRIAVPAETAALYPGLVKSVNALSTTVVSHASSEFARISGLCDAKALEGSAYSQLSFTVSDILSVQRADSRIVSIVERIVSSDLTVPDSAAQLTYRGYTFDTASGKQLTLDDIADNAVGMIADAYAFSFGQPAGGSAAELIGKLIAEEKLAWVLGFDGIDVMADLTDVQSAGEGYAFFTVPFDGKEESFKNDYNVVPKAYMTEFIGKEECFFDIDGDGTDERIVLKADYMGDESIAACSVSVDSVDTEISDIYGWNEQPVLVRTEDGATFLYLSVDIDAGRHSTYILNLSFGTAKLVGKIDGMIEGRYVDDPSNVTFVTRHDFLGITEETAKYSIGAGGLPQMKGSFFDLTDDYVVTMACDFHAEMITESGESLGATIELKEGEMISFRRFDGISFADAVTAGGQWIRFTFDSVSLWEKSFEGSDVDDLFIGIEYSD